MGEAKVRAAKAETRVRRFQTRRVVAHGGQLFQLERDGRVYGVRMVQGARIRDGAIVELVHKVGREQDAKEAAAVTPAEPEPAPAKPARKPRAKKAAAA